MCQILGQNINCHYLAYLLFVLNSVCIFLTICCIFYSWTKPRKNHYHEITNKQPYIIEKGPGYVKYFDKRNYESII